MKNWKTSSLLQMFVLVQAIVAFYSLAGVFGKLASRYDFLSVPFILFYGLEIVVLGVYAIAWQQVIKRMPLSIAYANRAMAIVWSMIWAVLLFHESITIANLIGVLIIVAGIWIVNSEEKEKRKKTPSEKTSGKNVREEQV